MTLASTYEYEPGEKTHRDENFPVASYLISGQHRPAILAFYRFARAADDVADHPNLTEKEKIARLDQFEATLLGHNDAIEDAIPLRKAIAKRRLSPQHPIELLIAFRQDASKLRYKNWDELMQYCRYSAAPVGRFVLDVHGEKQSVWPTSDRLCTALQIINHLQDCRADFERLNRIYIPEETFICHGALETDLGKTHSSPALLECIAELARKSLLLLSPLPLSLQVHNHRLALEVLAIEKVAHTLLHVLMERDPLSERVHLTKLQFASIIIKTMLTFPLPVPFLQPRHPAYKETL